MNLRVEDNNMAPLRKVLEVLATQTNPELLPLQFR